VSVETLEKYVKSGLLARRNISPPGSGKPRYRFRVTDLDRLKTQGYRTFTPKQHPKQKGRRPKRGSTTYDHLDL
jgi:predicted ArsR family transcriptional regulator